MIVSEQALTNVISKIRKTLSRVTCGCATIRTVSKTGYLLEIDESIKPSKTETVPFQVTEKVSKSNFSPVEQEVLAEIEISTDVNTATVTDSDLKTSSNQELNLAELEPSNSKSNTHLIKAGYLVALICVVVTAFNLSKPIIRHCLILLIKPNIATAIQMIAITIFSILRIMNPIRYLRSLKS